MHVCVCVNARLQQGRCSLYSNSHYSPRCLRRMCLIRERFVRIVARASVSTPLSLIHTHTHTDRKCAASLRNTPLHRYARTGMVVLGASVHVRVIVVDRTSS